MRRKLISLLTAILVLTGYSAPAFADEISADVQPEVQAETADSEEETDAQADTEVTGNETEETDDTVSEAEKTDETAETPSVSDEETPDEVTEDTDTPTESEDEQSDDEESDETAEENPGIDEQDVPAEEPSEAPEEEQTEEPDTSADETDDTVSVETGVPADAADETDTAEDTADEEELLEEELDLYGTDYYGSYVEIPNVGRWYSSQNTLRIDRQLGIYSDTGTNSILELMRRRGYSLSSTDIWYIYTESGAKAPSNCYYLFANLSALKTADLSNMDFSNTTTMESMFHADYALEEVKFSQSGNKTTLLTNVRAMFNGCSALKVSQLYSTDLCFDCVTDCASMYAGCSSITAVTLPNSLMRPANASGMFSGCTSLTHVDMVSYNRNTGLIDITNANTANMFSGCSKLSYLTIPKGFRVTSGMKLLNRINSIMLGTTDGWGKDGDWVISGNGTYAEFTAETGGLYSPLQIWYKWDSSTGTLTLSGHIPDTYIDTDGSDYDVAYFAGIDHALIKKIVIVNGGLYGTFTTSAEDMFNGLKNLTEIQGLDNLSVMGDKAKYMFSGCTSLRSVDLSEFNYQYVTDTDGMFFGCTALTSVKLPAGFEVTKGMKLMNAGTEYAGWSKKGSTGIISGTDTYAAFKADTAGEYIRVSNNLTKPRFALTPGSGNVLVKWDAVAGATSYRVYRVENGAFKYLTETSQLEYRDNGLTGNVKYGYLVRAFNGTQGSSYTNNDIQYTTPTAVTSLAKPFFIVTPGDGKVLVEWRAVPGAASYRIYRVDNGKFVYLTDTTSLSYTATGLAGGTEYGFLVRAFCGSVGSSYTNSDIKYATPTGLSIAKPEFTATAGNGSVTVKWNAVNGATSYRVYRKTGSSIAFLKEVTSTSYTDTGLVNGTKYGYLVRAFKGTAGTSYSDADWKYATPSASTALAKPDFKVTSATGSVSVKWSAVSGATAYRVYRMEGSTIKFLKEVTTTSYADTTVANGTQYGYLVRAFRGTTGSAYTNSDFKYTIPLGKPGLNIQKSGDHRLTLSWNKVKGAVSYRVYEYTNGTYKYICSSESNTIALTGVSNGSHGFLVRAINGSDGSSYTTKDIVYITV